MAATFQLRYPTGRSDFRRVISDISVILRENTLTIADFIETGAPVEIEIVRAVSLSATEITMITRLNK